MSFPEGIAFLNWANGLLIADEGNLLMDTPIGYSDILRE